MLVNVILVERVLSPTTQELVVKNVQRENLHLLMVLVNSVLLVLIPLWRELIDATYVVVVVRLLRIILAVNNVNLVSSLLRVALVNDALLTQSPLVLVPALVFLVALELKPMLIKPLV